MFQNAKSKLALYIRLESRENARRSSLNKFSTVDTDGWLRVCLAAALVSDQEPILRSYNTGVVKIYGATNSMARRFYNIFFL
jgi:hypothetical protein